MYLILCYRKGLCKLHHNGWRREFARLRTLPDNNYNGYNVSNYNISHNTFEEN